MKIRNNKRKANFFFFYSVSDIVVLCQSFKCFLPLGFVWEKIKHEEEEGKKIVLFFSNSFPSSFVRIFSDVMKAYCAATENLRDLTFNNTHKLYVIFVTPHEKKKNQQQQMVTYIFCYLNLNRHFWLP